MKLLRFLPFLCLVFMVRLHAAPGDIIFQENFNNNGDLNSDWDSTGVVDLNDLIFISSPNSVVLTGVNTGSSITSRTNRIDADVPGAELSVWIRRGIDQNTSGGRCNDPTNCSEDPDGDENLLVEYLTSTGDWITLETFTGAGTPGEIFTPTYVLPNNALYSGLRLRFTHSGGNGSIFDFWHIDDVIVTETVAPPPPSIPTPLADWRMDEDSWDGTAGEVVDSSGNGYNGTSFGTDTTTGFICNGGDFSPTGTSDYLSVDNRAMDGLGDFTISVWGQTTNNRSQGIVSGSSGSQHNELIMWWNSQTSFRPFLKGSSNGGNITARINNGEWRHLVWTRNGTQNCLYVDGIRQGNCVNRSAALLSIANGGLIIAQEQDSLGGGFSSTQDWEGSLDELLIFGSGFTQQQVSLLFDRQTAGNNWDGTPRSCPGAVALDHFAITAATTAVSCEPITVDVSARDASDNLFALTTDTTLTLSTSTGRGDWSGPGIANGTANDGQATLVIPEGSSGPAAGTIQLLHADLNGNSSETVNINIVSGAITEAPGQDPDIVVSLSGLRFVDESNNALIPTQVAGAGSPQNLYVQAIQVDPLAAIPSAAACTAVYSSGTTVTMRIAGECKNPNICAVSQMLVNGATIGVSDDNAGAGAASGFADVDLTFGANARAAISIRYDDVGLIQLHAQDQPGFIRGSSNDFVVRPHSFAVTLVEDGSGNANPGTTTPSLSGNGFMASGQAFRMLVEAQDAEGDITPNYGNEQIPETVAVLATPTLAYPTGVGAEAGNLTNNGAFTATTTAGEFENTTIRWNEVGTIQVTADVADSDYLGTGSGASSQPLSANIGRFYPAGFAVSGDTMAAVSCGAFSYLSQPSISIDYTLRAVNANGNVVTNYDNDGIDSDYSNDANLVGVVTYYAEDANDGINRGARFSDGVASTIWDEGVYQLSTSQAQFNRASATQIDGPFNNLQLSLTVADPDAATLVPAALNQDPTNTGTAFSAAIGATGASFTPLMLRYGRGVIENASGPETAPLPVTFGVQQWNGIDFENATTDACSSIALADIRFDTINPISNPQPVTVGSGATSGVTNGSLNSIGANAVVNGGTFNLSFSAPNALGQFPVQVDLTNYPWLRFDWNQDGNNDNDSSLPAATINFGSYRGHDRVIYWRELF